MRTNGMRTNHHAEIVPLKERVQVVWAEVHDVVLLLGVSYVVMLEPTHLLALMRVTPKQIDHFLMVLDVVGAELDLEWPLDFLDAFDIGDGGAESSMATEDPLLLICYDGSKRKVVEGVVDFREARVGVVDVLAEPLRALITKSKKLVDQTILVVASQHHDLLWVLQLQCHKKANYFEGVLTLVHVISQEQIVKRMDVSLLDRRLPDITETHKVDVLSVQVSENFDWGLEVLDDDGLGGEDL